MPHLLNLAVRSYDQFPDFLGRLFWRERTSGEKRSAEVVYSKKFHCCPGRFAMKPEVLFAVSGDALAPVEHIEIRRVHCFEVVSEFDQSKSALWGFI
jgi:hypothetical protein